MVRLLWQSTVILLATAAWILPCVVKAQQPFPKADRQDLGLIIPRGESKPGGDRTAVVRTEDGQTVVARIYLEIGNRFLVLLPNGRITSVLQNEATPSDRRFKPATSQEILEELVGGKFQGFKTRSTNHYVYVYNTTSGFFQATSRVLETMYPNLIAYCQRLGLDVQTPEMPLIVLMFHTEDEFNQYRTLPESVVAYYNEVNNYVVMYEKSNLAGVAPSVAVQQSISTIAHEGVHQILHNIGVQKRLSNWPLWIGEGLPEYFSPTEIGRRIRWSGVGKVNQLRLHTLVNQFKKQPITGNGHWLHNTITAERLDANGYAAAWALTDFLAKRRKKQFSRFLREVSQQKPLQPLPNQSTIFEKHFGTDYANIEKHVLKHLNQLTYVDPFVNQPHYLAQLRISGRRFLMISASPASIRQWQKKMLSRIPARTRPNTRLEIQTYPNRAAAEQAFRSF